WWIYESGLVEDAVGYFVADWRRIVAVAVFSTFGGVLVSFVMRLPQTTRHRVGAAVFGLLALLGAGGCVWSIWQLVRVRQFLAEARILWIVTAAELAACLLICWFSARLCRHYRKNHDSEKRHLAAHRV